MLEVAIPIPTHNSLATPRENMELDRSKDIPTSLGQMALNHITSVWKGG